ncbi:hypothetical protein TrVE_jg10975 [Triparma verrucosa]|uniref:EGF-like domain-containing protein n=1 Tax=Triparma verrucosa TaxID=1606542 RepID=A0A9W7FN34_9STRA|nr:hypothetical protein TrVE_jg10975 [Triparma verrucosa]
MHLQDASKTAYVYIKNNGLKHFFLGSRAFGAYQNDAGQPAALLDVNGREMRRTWSLLSTPLATGSSTMVLIHDPTEMGWSTGDRILISPTQRSGSQGEAEAFSIINISGNILTLSSPTQQDFDATFKARNGLVATKSAEVINLSRNLVITGDEFENVACDDSLTDDFGEGISGEGCMCTGIRSTCTVGLHTIASKNAVLKLQNARLERCGQRGIAGKYCAHMHRLSDSPDSIIRNNAFEHSMQRGVVIHGTHRSTISHNVFSDVRGAAMYIEDGNEMLNNLDYNVAICPWRLGDDQKWGCTIPGTSNNEADTSLNQAGVWALSPTNNMLGNRFSNSFNGMLYETNAFGGNGRQFSENKACTVFQPMGRIEGNTFHSHGRFGTYLLSSTWPKQHDLAALLANDGQKISDPNSCTGWTDDGTDRGWPSTLKNNVDYHNTFVGQYDAGDVMYENHFSESNNCLIYWKTSKDFADGCSSHLKGGYYSNGAMNLPDQGAFIIEDTTFETNVVFEANHHCNIGVTGMLCAPTYVFDRVTFVKPDFRFYWADDLTSDNMAEAAVFVMAPDWSASDGDDSTPFPSPHISLASSKYSNFLLSYDSLNTCVTSTSLGVGNRFTQGILCSKPLRVMKIWTFDQDEATAPALEVEIWRDGELILTASTKLYAIGSPTGRKQGYRFPVVLDDHASEYRIKLEGGLDIPDDWVIEFSDPVFGNRWSEETLKFQAQGRSCSGGTISSQHDRKWVFSSSSEFMGDNARGRGACSAHSDSSPVDCANVDAIELLSCEAECNGGTGCSGNSFCECGSGGNCKCEAGFSGESCEIDICEEVNCGPHGHCSARYLGGDLLPTKAQCVCDENWLGDVCDKNPCDAVSSDQCGSGVCVNLNENEWACECFDGWSGSDCSDTCVGFCQGEFPHSCNKFGGTYVYCNGGGGCMYQDEGGQRDNWCLMVGGGEGGGLGGGEQSSPAPTPQGVEDKCDCQRECNGDIPKDYLWCSTTGGCSYEDVYTSKGEDWCLFKGAPPTSAPTPAPVPCEDVCSPNPCAQSNPNEYLWCSSWGGCSYQSFYEEKNEQWCLYSGSAPTESPTKAPTASPTTAAPTTKSPTKAPSKAPSTAPTTKSPTKAPSKAPSTAPTGAPTTPNPTSVKAPTSSTSSPTSPPTYLSIHEQEFNILDFAKDSCDDIDFDCAIQFLIPGGLLFLGVTICCCACRRKGKVEKQSLELQNLEAEMTNMGNPIADNLSKFV